MSRPPRGRVVQRGYVEEQLRIRDALGAVVGEHPLQVADPHVVADDGEVLAAESRRGAGLVLAMRPWTFSLLNSLRAELAQPESPGGASARVAAPVRRATPQR